MLDMKKITYFSVLHGYDHLTYKKISKAKEVEKHILMY